MLPRDRVCSVRAAGGPHCGAGEELGRACFRRCTARTTCSRHSRVVPSPLAQHAYESIDRIIVLTDRTLAEHDLAVDPRPQFNGLRKHLRGATLQQLHARYSATVHPMAVVGVNLQSHATAGADAVAAHIAGTPRLVSWSGVAHTPSQRGVPLCLTVLRHLFVLPSARCN